MNFFTLAKEEYGFNVELIEHVKMEVMFEEDPGDVETRSTVHGYKLTRNKTFPSE